MTQLLLIRHAKNDWVGDRLAGWTPAVHLNDEGRAEAAALAERLAAARIDAVYASPLDRALETAAPLAAARGLAVQPLPGVAEVQYGGWTGRSLKELAKEPLWPTVQFYASGMRFPEGESMAEVQARALAALDEVRAGHPEGVVAVVSHADVIKLVVAHYAGVHLDLFQRLVVDTASLTVLRFTPFGPRLLRFNDTGRVPPAPEPAAESASESAAESAPEPEAARDGHAPSGVPA
jgi:probable phosphoglycerate mutase